MTRHGRLMLAVAVVMASGCASGPDYERPAVDLPSAFSRPVATLPAGEADPADRRWWQSFGDPALEALIETAVAGNRNLRVAVARLQEYQARAESVSAERYPTLGYRAGAGRERMSERRAIPLPLGVSPTNNQFEAGLVARWELDLWGRLKRADEVALAELLSAEESRRAVVMTLVADVASGYVQLLRLDAELAALDRMAALREAQIELQTRMVAGGAATELAVDRTRALLAFNRGVAARVQRARDETENALNFLAGRPSGPIARERTLDQLQPPGVPGGLPSDLLSRRPDVRRAEQDLIAANARIGVVRSRFLPSISLTAALGGASTSLSDLTLRSANTGLLGLELLGTLFDFGRLEGEVKVAEAQRLQLAEAYAAAAAQALREVEDALVARARTAEREKADLARTEALQRVAALQRTRLEGGSATALDVLAADLEASEAAMDGLQARHDGVAASIALFKAMGGGWIDLAAPMPPPPTSTAAAPAQP